MACFPAMRVLGNWATALPDVAYVLLLTHLLLIVVSHVKAAPVPPRGEAESRYESFASTRWSIVIEAGNSATVSAHAFNALSELCQIYWRPLYSFLRRQGCSPEDARDLIQGFFADLIETRAYARADRTIVDGL